jgi:hypothetical protein
MASLVDSERHCYIAPYSLHSIPSSFEYFQYRCVFKQLHIIILPQSIPLLKQVLVMRYRSDDVASVDTGNKA